MIPRSGRSGIYTRKGEIAKFYGDKAYDSNRIYDLVPEVVVPPKRSANPNRVNPRRRDTILEYGDSLRDWSRKRGYGKRWRVEIVISAIKMIFSDGIRARRPPGNDCPLEVLALPLYGK